jgi:hypothetical protein
MTIRFLHDGSSLPSLSSAVSFDAVHLLLRPRTGEAEVEEVESRVVAKELQRSTLRFSWRLKRMASRINA